MSRRWPTIAFPLFAALLACEAASQDETAMIPHGGASDRAPPPETAEECADRFLARRGESCRAGSCGEALECVEVVDGSRECQSLACSSNVDCEAELGDLCPGVPWSCEFGECTVGFGDEPGASSSPASGSSGGDGSTSGYDPSTTGWDGSTSDWGSSTGWGGSSTGWYGSSGGDSGSGTGWWGSSTGT